MEKTESTRTVQVRSDESELETRSETMHVSEAVDVRKEEEEGAGDAQTFLPRAGAAFTVGKAGVWTGVQRCPEFGVHGQSTAGPGHSGLELTPGD